MDDLSVILLAGGQGSRFGGKIPKQFCDLLGKPVALHSFDIFQQLNLEIVVVTEEEFQPLFPTALFAKPGKRRQDSVENGLALCTKEWIMVHDSARPFVSIEMVKRLYEAAKKTGAATTGMPMTSTIKQVCPQNFVQKTLDRSTVWEIQTPQIVRRDLLLAGFAKKQEVTDDVSLAELAGSPVQVVKGSSRNLKITHPEDLAVARRLHEV